MVETVAIDLSEATPDRADVLRDQGLPAGEALSERIRSLVSTAAGRFAELAEPRAVQTLVESREFDEILAGEGSNEPEIPLTLVAARAERLVLFALTLGQGLSHEIDRLIASNEPAEAHMLDAVASAGAAAVVRTLERRWSEAGRPALAYSPGYCGWHVSGQRRLLARLRPERIGITLNESFLMNPLKSVSGVLVVAPAEAHDFDDSFPFCDHCPGRECRERITAVFGR